MFVARVVIAALPALFAVLLSASPAFAQTPFTTPLPIPPVLTGADIEIPVVEANVPILPGKPTRMWTYAGTFPGPTIRRPAGAETRVRFVNQLPAAAGDLTVHNHGAHVDSVHDGQPAQLPGAGILIPAGDDRTYTYPLTENGNPERAAFQWYHDHRLDVTGRNVWNGLAGMFIIDDDVDAALPLPDGEHDVPLMVVDRDFDADNQLTYPAPVPFGSGGGSFPGTGVPPNDAFTGQRMLVNGAVQPYFDVDARRYRLRLLNASNSRVLTLSLSNGQTMQQIATESGLLPAPVARTAVTLGPAERAEVVVDFAGLQGQEVVLGTSAGDLLQLRVGNAVPDDPSSVPASLRPAPSLGTSTRERTFNLGVAEDPERGRAAWVINGTAFDSARVDASPKIGSTETWTFRGASRVHTVHIHSADFRIISRDGQAPPAWEQGLKETFLINPSEVVVVRVRFTDHLGRFVFHCHVLEHEDNGMMAQFDVSQTGDATPVAPPAGGTDPPVSPPPATPETHPTAAATTNLALRWTGAPRRISSGKRVRLRLRVGNDGNLPSATTKVAVAVPLGLELKGTRRRRLLLTVPALHPGGSRTLVVQVRRRGSPRSGTITARLQRAADGRPADDRAALSYRRSGTTLRLREAIASAASAAAVQRLLCRVR